MKKTLLLALLPALALAACADVPPAAYQTHGNPETLLDITSERISFPLNLDSVGDLTTWINKDRPQRAELSCTVNDPSCYNAIGVLKQSGIPYKEVQSKNGSNSLALIYERVLARDCDARYVDNHYNDLNLNHPTFGCAVAVNSVQMVTDRGEFLSPALRDFTDARRADAAYRASIKN